MAPQDAVKMRSPAWVAQPDDDDDDEMNKIGQKASAIGTTAWFLITSGVMLSMLVVSGKGPLGVWSTNSYLSGWDAPWWLTAIFAAEAYASFRRLAMRWQRGGTVAADPTAALTPKRTRRLRHFTSMRLVEDAPIEEIVAKFTELDALPSVRCLELGSNSSSERHSRGHSLGFMVSFVGMSQREAYLRSAERAAFIAFAEPFVQEWFIFDFESGLVDSM